MSESIKLGEKKIPPIYTKKQERYLKKYAATRSMPGGRRFRWKHETPHGDQAHSMRELKEAYGFQHNGRVKGSREEAVRMEGFRSAVADKSRETGESAVEEMASLTGWLFSEENADS